MRARDVHRPAFEDERPRRAARQRRAVHLVEAPGDHVELRPRETRHAAVRDSDPAGQPERFSVGAAVGDIVCGPVEAFGQIEELHSHRARNLALDKHRQRRLGRKILGYARIEHPFRKARAGKRLDPGRGLDDDAAVRSRLDHRLLLDEFSGRKAGAPQRDAALEIGVDEPRGRQQPRVAILFDDPVRQAADHRGFGEQPFRDAFESQHRGSRGQSNGARFGDEGKAPRPIGIDRSGPPRRRTIDGDRDIVDLGRYGDRLRKQGRGREQRRDPYQHRPAPHRVTLSNANRM